MRNEPVYREPYWLKVTASFGDVMICSTLTEIDRQRKVAKVGDYLVPFSDIRGLEVSEYEPCMMTEAKRAKEERSVYGY
jgi:hypothetical protein